VKPDIQSVLKMDALLDALEGEGSSYDNSGAAAAAAAAAKSGGGDAPVVVSGSLPATHKVTVTKVSLAAEGAGAERGGTPPSPSQQQQQQQQLVIKVEGLHEVNSLADASVCDLQVSDRAVTFTLLKDSQGQGRSTKHLKVSGPAGSFRLDPDSTAASFSKKKKALTVKVTLV
jgi:hypothetical protein